jgi:hypothetical protein
MLRGENFPNLVNLIGIETPTTNIYCHCIAKLFGAQSETLRLEFQ